MDEATARRIFEIAIAAGEAGRLLDHLFEPSGGVTLDGERLDRILLLDFAGGTPKAVGRIPNPKEPA